MQGYIDWELELVTQLERDGTHRFRVIDEYNWRIPAFFIL